MSQFDCEICGEGFEQKSHFDRHMLTSHPDSAPSAADLERALCGVKFPQSKSGLRKAFELNGNSELVEICEELPDREYRDAAEVARGFGEIRSHERKPDHQPSKAGGQAAMQVKSAARIASLFRGIDFPATKSEVFRYAQKNANHEELELIEQFRKKTYKDMTDVAKEVGHVTSPS